MSVNRASEVWKEIKPFAIRDMNRMLDNKAGDSGDDLYAIILYDESAQKIKYYSMSNVGLIAAIDNSSSGDIIFIPAGTINAVMDNIYSIGNVLGEGPIDVTDYQGETITGLTIGNLYCIETFNGYFTWGTAAHWLPLNGTAVRYANEAGGTPAETSAPWEGRVGLLPDTKNNTSTVHIPGLVDDPPSWGLHAELIAGNYGRMYFIATTESVRIRISEANWISNNEFEWVDNIGTLSWRLYDALAFGEITVPSGVELVGLGKNSIIDGPVTNNGILTNIQVTGAIAGDGIMRLVSNPTSEVISNQIKNTVSTGTAPLAVDSTTVVSNLNADMVDGEHATAFAEAVHNHTESDISDLDHDAQKINGVPVDLTGIEDGDVLVYDSYEDKIIPGEGGGSGAALTIEEQDGTPSIADVKKIKVTNGTLTDDGSGVVSLDFGSAATDGSAIHNNEANEISAITEKTTPSGNDLLLIEDSAASYVKKSIKISNLPGSINPFISIENPPKTGWSWLNQGGASVDESNDYLVLNNPDAEDRFRGRIRAVPTAPYKLTVGMIGTGLQINRHRFGLWLYESGSGKLVIFYNGIDRYDIRGEKWNSVSSFNTAYFNILANSIFPFLQIEDNGTNRMLRVSNDGVNFITIHSVSRTDFLTPDYIGFCSDCGSTYPIIMNLFHWLEE